MGQSETTFREAVEPDDAEDPIQRRTQATDFKDLHYNTQQLPHKLDLFHFNLSFIRFCVEEWESENGRDRSCISIVELVWLVVNLRGENNVYYPRRHKVELLTLVHFRHLSNGL